MSYVKFQGSFLSTNRFNKVNYYICEPESEILAVVQFAHGWADCFDRNSDLIDFFTSHGIMVCGCDFIGHNFLREDRTMDFKRKNAWTYLVNDLRKLSHYIKREYPQVPLYLYGHGLGSLVARMTMAQREDYAGAILSGTSGTQHFCRRSLITAQVLGMCRGADYKNYLIQKMLERKINHHFSTERDSKAWECSDPEHRIVNNLGAEETAFYTMEAMRDMFYMLANVQKKEWYQSVAQKMPILLISGAEDPVGNFGKGIKEIEKKLKSKKCDVTMHLYDNMRHNIQDEPDHDQVFTDIIRWMKIY